MGASRTGNTCRTSKRPKESVTFVKFLPTMQETISKRRRRRRCETRGQDNRCGESCDLHVTVT